MASELLAGSGAKSDSPMSRAAYRSTLDAGCRQVGTVWGGEDKLWKERSLNQHPLKKPGGPREGCRYHGEDRVQPRALGTTAWLILPRRAQLLLESWHWLIRIKYLLPGN